MNMLNEDPSKGSEWKLLLAVFLSLVILLGSQYWIQSTQPPQLLPPFEPVAAPDPGAAQLPGGETSTQPQRAALSGEDTQGDIGAVVMENESIRLTWSTLRAGLSSALLLDFEDSEGEPLEVVPQNLKVEVARPYEVLLSSIVFDEVLKNAVFEVEGGLDGAFRPRRDLTMVFRRGSLEIRRTVHLPRNGYVFEVETDVQVDGQSVPYGLTLGTGFGPEAITSSWKGDFAYPRIVFWNDGPQSVEADDIDQGQEDTHSVPARWAAFDGLYFTSVILGDGLIEGIRVTQKEETLLKEGAEDAAQALLAGVVQVKASAQVGIFIGPKYRDTLRMIEPTLVDVIDYGKLALLVKPLVAALRFVNGFIGNYGFSIIFLTFLINLLLAPIRLKQVTSMKKMSEVQPQLKAIQDRYKKMKRDDPRRAKMNEEVMALYKEKGVNPLGGCLPLVVQMPFLLAFYQMVAYSIELRGAPFMLWIQDLSQPDPYYITPLAMGVSMLLQQKMTPSTGDPMQRRMMMMMPVMFTFFFLSVSSGLAVYFLFSNLFGMLFQQLFKSFTGGGAEVAVPSGKPKKNSSKSGKKSR